MEPITLVYPAALTLDPDDGGYVVTFPDLPEAITQGDDRAAAFDSAVDCLDEAVASRLLHGEAIPDPSAATSRHLQVPLPPLTAFKAALHRAMAARGASRADLARALGVDYRETARLLDPRHRTHIDRLEAALAALDCRAAVGVAGGAESWLAAPKRSGKRVTMRDASGRFVGTRRAATTRRDVA